MSRGAQRSSRTYAQGWREAWAVSGTPVWILVGAMVAWGLAARALWGADPMWAAYRGGSLVPLAVEAGQWWRVFTAGVLHLDLIHLGVNAVGLALLGRMAQRVFGGGRMLLVFFGGAFVGTAISLLTPDGWSLGASSGVFALMAALLVTFVRVRPDTPISWRQRARNQILPWLLALIAITYAQLKQADHLAHAGGAILGAVSGLFMGVIPLGARRFNRGVVAGLVALTLVGLAAIGSAVVNLDPGHQAVGSIQVPANWVPGPALPPCENSVTDGFRFVCSAVLPSEWDEAQVHAHFTAEGYVVSPVAEAMPGWSVSALKRAKATHQFGRLCLRRESKGWTAVMLRAPAQGLYLPHRGCDVSPSS